MAINTGHLRPQMTILGIDPALSKIGWGLVNLDYPQLSYLASGLIHTKANQPIHKRLAVIACQLEAIILQYQPAAVAMEETFVNMNAGSSLKLGYARGAIMALIGKYDLYFQEFTPNAIKKAVVGAGHAQKAQVLYMIRLLLPAAPPAITLDEADALAAAYTLMVSPTFSRFSSG